MELTNILSSFFMRYGDSFSLDDDTTLFYGRLVQNKDGGKRIVTQLGEAISGEYELITPTLSGLSISKGMVVGCAGKKFTVISINEYTLNDTPIYYNAILREIGGEK